MRTMMSVSVPVEIGNATIKDGTLAATVKKTLEQLQPESAYFYTDEQGRRCCSVVFDLEDRRRYRSSPNRSSTAWVRP